MDYDAKEWNNITAYIEIYQTDGPIWFIKYRRRHHIFFCSMHNYFYFFYLFICFHIYRLRTFSDSILQLERLRINSNILTNFESLLVQLHLTSSYSLNSIQRSCEFLIDVILARNWFQLTMSRRKKVPKKWKVLT